MKIKLDYQKIKDQDEETLELFREFIDRVVAGEVFAGRDPQDYDLLNITADIELEIETEEEYHNQSGMTDRNGNEFIRFDENDDEDNYFKNADFNDYLDDDTDVINRN